MATPAVPLHIHALLSGVLPPFSSFLAAVLLHYKIHTLHLDPSSLLVTEEQCSGCASLKTANASVPGALDAELLPKAEGFLQKWVLVKTAEAGVLFQPPLTPATPNWEWRREEINDPGLVPVLTRLGKLKRAGVTMAMVVREFFCRRIAPLQRHSRPMWAYAGRRDAMRIQILPLSSDVLCELLRRLTGDDRDELLQTGLPLDKFKAPGALVAEMPLFED
ncbi:hypothetical protein D1007_11559 [Hordeum vulgare]|nr:hypothetical protein D1007_11559 [Hordeum vulgare]